MTSLDCFVTVTVHEGMAVIEVRRGKTPTRFLLTKRGCLAAGHHLCTSGVSSWLYSSSVDYPKDYKKSFRYDARELIEQGFRAAQAKATDKLDPLGLLEELLGLTQQVKNGLIAED